MTPKCPERNKITPEGKCEECADFTIPSKDKHTCVHPDCGA
jgi:hypothetical protein